jgi:outer membrane immunogenic protein
MKKLLLSTVSLLALASAAGAADMPVKAVRAPVEIPTWAGFYLGIQGGVASHKGYFNDIDDFASNGANDNSTPHSDSKIGGIFGVNAGYNFQSGNFVYGVEGDWSWLGVKAGSTTFGLNGFAGSSFVTSYDVRWLATARARVGLAVDANLFYVTGGAAFGGVNNTANNLLPGILRNSFTQNTTKIGWTVGGGIEHMFGPHWTARAEARYVDLGRSSVSCTPGSATCNSLTGGTYRGEFRNSLLLGLLALDYKF